MADCEKWLRDKTLFLLYGGYEKSWTEIYTNINPSNKLCKGSSTVQCYTKKQKLIYKKRGSCNTIKKLKTDGQYDHYNTVSDYQYYQYNYVSFLILYSLHTIQLSSNDAFNWSSFCCRMRISLSDNSERLSHKRQT